MEFSMESDMMHADALDLLSTLEKTDLVNVDSLVPLDSSSDLDSTYLEAFQDLSDLLGVCKKLVNALYICIYETLRMNPQQVEK